MLDISKILFVSQADICRGPMAESIYRRLDVTGERQAFSRGLVVLFPEPMNTKAMTVLENAQTPCTKGQSRAFDPREVNEKTLVLTMTAREKEEVLRQCPDMGRIETLKEFAGEMGDIEDPYGSSLVRYQDCYGELVRLIKKTLYRINEKEERE